MTSKDDIKGLVSLKFLRRPWSSPSCPRKTSFQHTRYLGTDLFSIFYCLPVRTHDGALRLDLGRGFLHRTPPPPSMRTYLFLLLAPPLTHPVCIRFHFFCKYCSFFQELVLGYVDVVTQRDETPRHPLWASCRRCASSLKGQ
jgi:hypothetical protein